MTQVVKTKVLADTKDAQKGFKGLSTNVKAVGIAVTAMGVAFAKAIDSVATAGDELDKMATRTGISVETLSEYTLALEKSDTSLQSFGNSLKRLARNISDADDGLTTATRGFERVNVQFKDNAGNLREVDDILPDIIRGINQLSTETEKAAVAQELFGRGGSELLVFLKEGNEAIQEQVERARELGLVWSEEDTKASAEFKDSLSELNLVGGALLRDMLSPMLGVLTDIVTGFNDATAGVRGFISNAQKLGVKATGRTEFSESDEDLINRSRVARVGSGAGATSQLADQISNLLSSAKRARGDKRKAPTAPGLPGVGAPESFTDLLLGDPFGDSGEEAIANKIALVNEQMEEFGEALDKLGQSKLVQFQLAFGETFSSLFQGILTGTSSFGDNFRRLWSSILEGLIQDVTQSAGEKIGGFLFRVGAGIVTGGTSEIAQVAQRAPGGLDRKIGQTNIVINALDSKSFATAMQDRRTGEAVLNGLRNVIDRG